MKKAIKRIGMTAALIISLCAILIGVSFTYHHIQLSKEDKQLVPPGQLVDVNGHQMHVYTEGHGEETLVFMAGGGTSSPFLDFKSLYSIK